jgi:hypothetical protein
VADLMEAAAACWRGHIWMALQLVNGLFANSCRPSFGSLNLAKTRREGPKATRLAARALDSPSENRFKARKSLEPKDFSDGRKAEAIRWIGR